MEYPWRRWFAYIAGILMVGFSLYLYMQFTSHYKAEVTTMRTFKPFRPLQVGEIIEDDMVQTVVIPVAAHDEHAVMDLNQIRGKKVKVPMSTSDEFVDWKLADELIIPLNGQRYFSFKTDSLQNVANMVRRGDRVDVWVELDKPRSWIDDQGQSTWIGTVKLLENVLVADVKSPEGIEIEDVNEGNGVFQAVRIGALQNNVPDMEHMRAKPNAKPEVNTFIMTEAEYNVYVMGALTGKIKLSLTDMSTEKPAQSKISDMFYKLQAVEFFNKDGVANK